jgi:hypothetical protein
MKTENGLESVVAGWTCEEFVEIADLAQGTMAIYLPGLDCELPSWFPIGQPIIYCRLNLRPYLAS